MWTPRNTYCIFEQEIMFWTSLHMSVGRNSQYTCVYVSKSGIRLVIFLANLLSWHRLQALMFENSHHKLTSNFSLPYPFHVPEDAWVVQQNRPLMTGAGNNLQLYLCHPNSSLFLFLHVACRCSLAFPAFFYPQEPS